VDHDQAISVLRLCATEAGMQASGSRLGHHQVWARDSMITLLGARFAGDPQIDAALKASVAILRQMQARAGAIPNNVDVATLRPNFRAYADAGLWWIVGSSLVAPDPATTAAVLAWYDCQDVDQSSLISMQESADWQDLFCTRGKGLYLNCLYVLALGAAGEHERAALVAEKINQFFWYEGDGNMLRHIAHTFSTESKQQQDSLGRKRWLPVKRTLVNEQYYLPYLGFRAVGEWFDSLGNLLAILSGVANQSRTATILDFIEQHGMAASPIASLTPVIEPGDPDWRDYYGMLNVPYHYHNGGVWPFIGGFYVAALVKAGRHEAAARVLDRLTALNRAGEFNEWHHGKTFAPMGVTCQAWSAGMYLFACECVRRSNVPDGFFGIGGNAA
jgi:Alkaline and neutral invertase